MDGFGHADAGRRKQGACCQQRGCEAMGNLSADQQAALRAGSSAKVTVGVGSGKSATFDFSLTGFSAAHDALKKKTGA